VLYHQTIEEFGNIQIKGKNMKNIAIVFFVVIVGFGVYYFLKPVVKEEYISNKSDKQEISVINTDSLSEAVDANREVVKKKKTLKKSLEVSDEKGQIITDSKVLKQLVSSLYDRDWDTFDKVYNSKKIELRKKGDHSQFYEQFKNLLIDNEFPIAEADGLLSLLTDTGTKESLKLLFEMYNDGTISNDEVQSRQSVYFLDSTRRILEDPSVKVDKQALMQALKEEYKKTENNYLRNVAAKLIARYDSTPQTQVMLFQDYMQEEDSAKKSAAQSGLMHLHGEELLPALHDNLRSDYQEVRQTAGMVLANMATHKAVETLTEWTMEKATVENAEELKRWYGEIIKTNGIYKVTKNIETGKIRDEELRGELERFFEEALEKEKNREVRE
jgi:hypothetical protein